MYQKLALALCVIFLQVQCGNDEAGDETGVSQLSEQNKPQENATETSKTGLEKNTLTDKVVAGNPAGSVVSPSDSNRYEASIVPEKMTVHEKKARFKALLVPPVQKVYQELKQQHEDVTKLIADGKGQEKIDALKEAYRAKTNEDLLAALKPHPPSIVLAQAAMESAWGTSRFFVKAKNVFGVWSFDKNEPRIAAGEQRGAKTIWLKKYDSIEASVRDNYRVLARSHAFAEFRSLRVTNDNPYDLVKKLDKYSEKGAAYGEELSSMISFNKFFEYDEKVYPRH